MRSFRLILASGLLTGMAAYAQAAPAWSAYIGTGHAADGRISAAALSARVEAAATASHSSTQHWSAFIGAGQAACLESVYCSLANSYRRSEGPHASSAPAPQATFDWSAMIGTGHSADAGRTR
jgi:hypothetical protein